MKFNIKMSYFLYIDESGVPTNPTDPHNLRIPPIFCLGGIIVNEKQKQFFVTEHQRLISTYFKEITLDEKFKLHYYPLRMNQPPYKDIGKSNALRLHDEIFDIIKRSNATLLSFTVDLAGYYKQYPDYAVDPLAYGLICLIERLTYYMKEHDIKSTRIIYERLTKKMKDNIFRAHHDLGRTKFRTHLDLKQLWSLINSGNPIDEPVLQFTDFWTYLPFVNAKNKIIKTQNNSIQNQSFANTQYTEQSFSDQIYNYNNSNSRRAGNVNITY